VSSVGADLQVGLYERVTSSRLIPDT